MNPSRLTEGSVKKTFILFSLPFLLSYFLQTLYGMADLFITGQFSQTAQVSAVSIGSQVMHMLTVMIVGLMMGATVRVGQATGAGDRQAAARGIGSTITLSLFLAIGLTSLLLFLVQPIVQLLQTPAEAVEATASYLRICFLGLPFIIAYNLLSAIFRGLGDSKSPMYFIAFSCVVNIGLDYWFIGALGMGAAGAAWGTILAQAASVVFALGYLYGRHYDIPLHKKDLRPDWPEVRALLRIGLPVCLQDGLIQIAFLLITVIANQRGLTDSAAVGITEKFISFVFLVPSSLLATVSSLGAQNIGAGKPERAREILRFSLEIAIGFGLIVSLLVQLCAAQILGFFSTDPAVIQAGSGYLRGYIWDCLFAGMHFSFSGYFCACSHSELSFIQNATSVILFRVPGAWLMSRLFPTTLLPMGLATTFSSFASVLICLVLMHQVKPLTLQNA